MIRLWWLIRVRVLEVTRVRATMVFFFVVPLVMLVAVGLVFANGHPFERRRVAVVGASPEAVVRALRGFPEAVPVEYPDEASARHSGWARAPSTPCSRATEAP